MNSAQASAPQKRRRDRNLAAVTAETRNHLLDGGVFLARRRPAVHARATNATHGAERACGWTALGDSIAQHHHEWEYQPPCTPANGGASAHLDRSEIQRRSVPNVG